MKQKYLLMLTAVILLSAPGAVNAQSEENDYSLGTSLCGGFFNPSSPEAAAMSRYGDLNVSLFTGALAQDIPIYVYKDNDFDIPVSISYGSTGFKPGQALGSLGLGWFLNVGGVITREVRGIPDEATNLEYVKKDEGNGAEEDAYHLAEVLSGSGSPYLAKSIISGYYQSHKLNVSGYASLYAGLNYVNDYDYAYTGELGSEYLLCRRKQASSGGQDPYLAVEVEPDVYHYNFLGYKGSFVLQPGGRIIVFDANTPAGEITVTYNWSPTVPLQGSFEISTGDGTIYTFGLREDAESTDEQNANTFDPSYTAGSWRLTRIQTQTGRVAQFVYSSVNQKKYSYQPAITIDHLKTTDTRGHVSKNWEHRPETVSIRQMIVNIADNYPISQIIINDRATVNFDYSDGLLSQVAVVNNENQEIHKATLTYKKKNPVVFLKSLSISGKGKTMFDYYDEDANYPVVRTPGIDWYGYYNGQNYWHTTNYSENGVNAMWNTRNALLGSGRSVYDFTKTKMGMLKRITYPTGGYSEIVYGQNKYGRDYTVMGASSGSYTTAGLRVERIDNCYRDGTLAQKRSFEYSDIGGGSSGVLIARPLIYTHYQLVSNYLTIDRECVSTTSQLGFGRPNIEYTRVVETVEGLDSSEGKMITEYIFASSVSSPLSEYYHSATSQPVVLGGFNLSFTEIGSEEHEFQRSAGSLYSGKVLSRTVYANSLAPTNIVNRNENTYALFTIPNCVNDSGDYVLLPSMYRSTYSERYVARMSSYVGNSSESVYGEDHNLIYTKDKTVVLNTLGRETTITMLASDGASEIINIGYNNALPARVETTIQTKGGTVCDAKKYQYGQVSLSPNVSAILPTTIYRGKYSGGSTVSWDPVLYVDQYDTYGNPVQTRDANSFPTSYLWGYKGQYLSAKIEGLNYTQACTLTGTTSGAQGNIGNNANVLRNTNGVRVSTWSWKPLVGILSETDPSGRSNNYTYDTEGRLASISKEGSTLKTFEYKYAYPTEISQ
jgi:hypothetical protein